jgi:hypothetical protein
MKHAFIIQFVILGVLFFAMENSCAAEPASAEENKQLIKNAVIYALENNDPHMDYSKYVAKDFVNPIDGNVFNYEQWVAHQKHIKELVRSMKPAFDVMVAEGNNVAAIYHIDIVKNDNSKLTVKDMAFFKIAHGKIVYCEELTRLITGNEEDKNIGSTK